MITQLLEAIGLGFLALALALGVAAGVVLLFGDNLANKLRPKR